MLQASEGDVSVGTDELGRSHKLLYYFCEDVGSSRDMHIELLTEGIHLFKYSLR